MARTPSMTAAEGEYLLGPRGDLCVTSDNRGLVQKWLVAKGVPAGIAKGATLSMLASAYNDTSDSIVCALIAKAREAIRDNTVEQHNQPKRATKIDVSKFAEQEDSMTPSENTKNDAAKHLQAALALIAGAGGAMDESRVIELIHEHAPKPENPIYRIEIKKGDETRELPEKPRHEIFETALRVVEAGCNLFLVGPAGSGKTTLAEQIAEALGFAFHFNGALDSPYKLSGFIDAQGRIVSTAFRRAYQDGGVYLFDEIDASLPGALLAFNAALANGHADFPDGTITRHENFRCIAAANTYGTGADRQYVGRNQLDAASLDRFVMLEMPYDEKLERMLAGDNDWTGFVQSARRAVALLKLRHVVSPRASIHGARLLASGMNRETVERVTLWKGMSNADISKVRENMN